MSIFKFKSRNPHARSTVVYDLACMVFGHKYAADVCQRCTWHRTIGF